MRRKDITAGTAGGAFLERIEGRTPGVAALQS
jgi:hypothetical protein